MDVACRTGPCRVRAMAAARGEDLVETALRVLARRYGRLQRRVAQLRASARRYSRQRRVGQIALILAVAAAYTGIVLTAGLAAGVAAERDDLPGRLARRFDFEQRIASLRASLGLEEADVQRASWREAVLNQHTLEWASIRIRPPGIRGGALVEVGGHIVFSSPMGRFNYLSPDYRFDTIALQAPTNIEALRRSALHDNPLFPVAELRVHDLAARQTGPESWELYASLSRFEAENCYQFQVVRARLRVTARAVEAVSPDWETVFTARPGCIPNKDSGWLFQGVEAGGRMAFLDDHTMLVSVGDHQFDGFNDHRAVAMDPDWDLGKIIALDVNTGASRIYTSGMRNPQGLVVMRDGRIFSTEHGPQGGDEINFIREGANYGWPQVSYGMNYGFPRRDWGDGADPGQHAGYTRPALAFVPAIGISNLAQPSAEEFPSWGNDDLLMLSLRAGALFHVALNGEQVAYVEPVEMGTGLLARERLRDIISLHDGRMAIVTDSGDMILVRNAERHANESHDLVVSGYSRLSAPMPEELFDDTGTRAQRGRSYFQIACASCHSLDGSAGIGPPLNGVVGREMGAVANFGYSNALAGQDRTWNVDLLRAYITDPQHVVPGTVMPAPPISWSMAPEIVDYLGTTR
ncbi:MAG: PQQ-dependent sugar dehydrogenase [Hyphomonadaceae bacterium]